MRFMLLLLSGAFCASLAAQAPTLTGRDADLRDAHDRPVGTITMRLPFPGGQAGPEGDMPPPPPTVNPTPPSEDENIPPSEAQPAPPTGEAPPPYYGEPAVGKFAMVLDVSGSMGGPRIAAVRAETTGVIQALTEDDEFDLVAYGDQFGSQMDYSSYLWGGLLPATEGNKSAAITWVNGHTTNPGGGTPTYAALRKACLVYPSDLDKLFLLTDGSPNTSGSAAQILSDFPAWWTKFPETTLVCICIGGVGPAMQFMQALAALAGGVYIAA